MFYTCPLYFFFCFAIVEIKVKKVIDLNSTAYLIEVYGGVRGAKRILLTRSRAKTVIESDEEMTTDVISCHEHTHVCRIANVRHNLYNFIILL